MNHGSKKPADGRPRDGRRKPPAEWTGAEEQYLEDSKARNVPMLFRLRDGGAVRGVIEHCDRETVKIQCGTGPQLLIRKSDIRYVQEDPDSSGP